MVRAKHTAYWGPHNSAHVLDGALVQCDFCDGTMFRVSTTIDDPNDITGDTTFAALLLTNAGFPIFSIVGQCLDCGKEKVIAWYIMDVGANTGAATTMTHLVQATTADLMAGLYMFPLVGTDIGKYFVIASNTAADPTVITTTIAPNDDSDGYWVITNLLPVGLTAAS
jgi:hypothetical protein